MKCRIRPIRNPFAMVVFYRIEMDIIYMPRKIGLVADLVLPIALLPKR